MAKGIKTTDKPAKRDSAKELVYLNKAKCAKRPTPEKKAMCIKFMNAKIAKAKARG